jgi:peptidoglycan/xylan/chitin deacetylase (PgdA/CDA1 family)
MKINKKPNLVRVIALVIAAALIILGIIIFNKKKNNVVSIKILSAKTPILTMVPTEIPTILPTKTPELTQISTITPTPALMSFEDMNKNFGPCVRVNVLIYHHIQNEDEAKIKNQVSLSVTPDFFRKHLQYLKDKNYTVIGPKDLIAFFGGTEQLSGKLVMITFDDAYEDNYINAYPVLKEFGIKAVIFTPTGLVNNLDYFTWDQMNQMKDLVYFGNHTWSHHSSGGTEEKQDEEIGLADKQLSEKGFNNQNIFAYPYGKPSGNAEEVLRNKKYNLAFTTTHGNIMCKGKSLELPRIRVGNAPLNKYGL